jgi:hypothetical protein
MRLGGKCLLLIEPLTLVFPGHSFTFHHDVLRLLMTHSRLRITHALTNPSHAPLSLLFFYSFIPTMIIHLSHTPSLILFFLLIRSARTMFGYVWLR